MDPSKALPSGASRSVGFGASGALVLFVTAIGILLETAAGSTGLSRAAAASGAAAFAVPLGVFLWGRRATLPALLASIPFATVVGIALLVGTALGTLVVQGQPLAVYRSRYPSLVAEAVLFLRFDDLFHSYAFNAHLCLLAVGLVVVTIRRKQFTLPTFGFFLAHVGVVLVLVGAAIGHLFGEEGWIDLREGQSVTAMRRMAGGEKTAEMRELGFAVRLDRFEIDRYPAEYRVYAYDLGRSRGLALQSSGQREIGRETLVPKVGLRYRTIALYPDFALGSQIAPRAAEPRQPAMRLEGECAGAAVDEVLAFAPGARTSWIAPDRSVEIRFVWEVPPEGFDRALLAPSRPARHFLRLGAESAGEIEVETGRTYDLGAGAWSVEVERFLPHFNYDVDGRRAVSLSEEPVNPALEVRLCRAGDAAAERTWLFASSAVAGHGDPEGARPTYRFDPGSGGARALFVVIGSERALVEIRGGAVARRALLAPDGALPVDFAGFRGRVADLLGNAEVRPVPRSLTKEWRRPVAEVELLGDEAGRRLFLEAGEPVQLQGSGGPVGLVFRAKPDDVEAYRSDLTVLAGGTPVKTARVEVNAPLAHDGYWFYQSSFDPKDPRYSGIQVIRDPGLWIVFVGMALAAAGVPYIFYVQPAIERRRRRARGEPAPS